MSQKKKKPATPAAKPAPAPAEQVTEVKQETAPVEQVVETKEAPAPVEQVAEVKETPTPAAPVAEVKETPTPAAPVAEVKKESDPVKEVVEAFLNSRPATIDIQTRRYRDTFVDLEKLFTLVPTIPHNLGVEYVHTADKKISLRAEEYTGENDSIVVETILTINGIKVPSNRKDKKLQAVLSVLPKCATAEYKEETEDGRLYAGVYNGNTFAIILDSQNVGSESAPKWEYSVALSFADIVGGDKVMVEATEEEVAEVMSENETEVMEDPDPEIAEASEEKPKNKIQAMAEAIGKKNPDVESEEVVIEDDTYEMVDDYEEVAHTAVEPIQEYCKKRKKSKKRCHVEKEERRARALKTAKICGIVVASVAVVAGITYLVYRFVIKKA